LSEGGRSFGPPAPTDGITWFATTSGGITWLRRLAGDRHFQFLDRVISVQVEPEGLSRAAQLPDVGSVAVVGEVSGDQLAQLTTLKRLDYLALNREGIPPAAPQLLWTMPRTEHSRPRLTLPRLPQVRELSASDFDCDGLGNLPSLECVQWWYEPVDEELTKQLAALPNLQIVDFHNCVLLDGGLAQLKAKQNLSALSFNSMALSDNCCELLGQLSQLTFVEIAYCELNSPRHIRHLGSLTRLETLYLTGTNVDDDSIRHLTHLPKLKALDLSGTRVTSKSMAHLLSMKQLRELWLTGGAFTPEDSARLKAELPGCRLEVVPFSIPFSALKQG
jgi:Leucine-rich repeat (LRR) protein